MRLPKLAIENYQFTLVMVLLIIALGITSLRTMPRAEDPQFTFPGFSVLFVYPGANPEDVEQLVVDPLERQLNELDDVKEIRTRIEEGFAVTVIEFFTSVDTDEAEDDVRMTAANARAEMPEAVFAPVLQKFSPTGVAMMQVALISETAPYAELQDLVEELQDALERTSGVKRVETWAYPETEVHVDVDLDRLGYRNVTLSQVAQALQSANANVPGGSLDIGSRRFSVRSTGDYESIEDIANTVVSAGPSGVVYLRDLADVRPGQAELNYHARFNGKRAVFATVLQQDGTNIYEVRENIESALETFGTQVPSNVEMDLVFDQKVSVEARLGQFFSNLFQGLLLVGLVVMLVLGLRAASIVMTAIPVSLLAAVAIFDYTGYALQQMSIVGLMIALGLLVDNAIVVVENIHRFRRMGHDGPTAAVLATKQVGWAIVSSTVTTVLSFLPMVFLGGGSGSFIRSMPVAVICALFASLFIALTLTPYLASRLIKADERRQPWFQRQFERISEGAYAQTLSLALKRPVVTGLLAVGLLA
ncbi:MAG: efflux RND transporter permease subunit, partial [Bacteroidota bacterium]